MRIALLQLNPIVCDVKGNAQKILAGAISAGKQGADLCVTPELAIIGYPPQDLLFRRDVLSGCKAAVDWLAEKTRDLCPLLVGGPVNPGLNHDRNWNGAYLLTKGSVHSRFCKTLLPSYDVFDEQRYFMPGSRPGFFEYMGNRIGVTICEDVWNDSDFWGKSRYSADPAGYLAEQGVDLIINMSASPFSLGRQEIRRDMLSAMAGKHKVMLFYCNQVGGNDELVFSGQSMALDRDGRVMASAAEFEEDILVVDIRAPEKASIVSYDSSPEHEVWQALCLGLKDYVRKTGFSRVVLGLSGGIDSALVTVLAARALGPENVTGLLMPSPYSSRGSIDDSLELAANLGIKTRCVPIEELMSSFETALDPVFSGIKKDVTEENIQARIRSILAMAWSNKFGDLVLATGNKSELAVGYSTIYGDMAGGLAPLADVPKTFVYSLARWINSRENTVIPERIINKAPSAELKPDQKDQDCLPEYEILDQILHKYIHDRLPPEVIIEQGFAPDTVRKVVEMVRKAEFKRRQAPPGIRISSPAFGMGWKMPVAAKCTSFTE